MNGIDRIAWWIWLVPAMLLIIATQQLPYGYYTFLRIVVCTFATIIAFRGWKDAAASRAWPMTFAGIAILFNPIIPVFLQRSDWFYLDLGAAAIIVTHLVIVRRKNKQSA